MTHEKFPSDFAKTVRLSPKQTVTIFRIYMQMAKAAIGIAEARSMNPLSGGPLRPLVGAATDKSRPKCCFI
ncbi:hypothetical protein CJD38_09230 [Stenotrophobium rhamnosiphilum]|uniref:Uncharacterized protein n=1 Tax=Stenotrophobium rhamnosiphilum TaxID=2029166 RepID=A0A2T5MFZ4_9GAMM|nr:hypothetical protein CJD38_09230 [Stenotrophobium rhamnosiphilum]